jgi:hypothetical protein
MRLKAEAGIDLSKMVESGDESGVRLTGCVTPRGHTVEIVG